MDIRLYNEDLLKLEAEVCQKVGSCFSGLQPELNMVSEPSCVSLYKSSYDETDLNDTGDIRCLPNIYL